MIVYILLAYLLSPTYRSTFSFSQHEAVFFNPSVLEDRFVLSLVFATPYSIKGLNFYEISLSFKNLGFGVQTLVFGDFYQTSLNLGYGVRVKKSFSAGAAIELVQLVSESAHSKVRFFGGISSSPSENLTFGVSFFNLYSTSHFDPGSVSFQLMKRFTGDFKTAVNLVLEEGQEISPRIAVFYRLIRNFELIMGFSSNPDEYFAGVNILKGFKFTYSVGFHPYLGITQVFEVSSF